MKLIINQKAKKAIITLGLLFLWGAAVFLFSAQKGEESKQTSSYFVNVITNGYEKLCGNKLSQESIHSITFFIRKVAHFTLYFVLAILLYELFGIYGLEKKKIGIYVIIGSILCACLDEFHQSFVPEREAAIRDILIDVLGSVIGLGIINVVRYRFKSRKKVEKMEL